MIEAVLFDLMGVLTTSPWTHIAAVADLEFLVGPYDQDTDHAFHRLERGEITGIEYATDVMARAENAGITVDVTQLRTVLSDVDIHHHVLDRIRSLRAGGLRTGLITNNVREAAERWRELIPVDDLFDVIVDSSAVGMRKPNPAIFTLALALLGGVTPDRAVFLDDTPSNVSGAEAAGLHAILVDAEDPLPALAELDTLIASLA